MNCYKQLARPLTKGKCETLLMGSCADHGTTSISSSYERVLQPAASRFFDKGLKYMSWSERAQILKQINSWAASGGKIVCLFNQPIVIASFASLVTCKSCAGVLDWTQAYPASGKQSLFIHIYNMIYVRAFMRLHRVCSPAPGFREYYNRLGAPILPTRYPLPYPIPEAFSSDVRLRDTRVLFVGADYHRKGGDLLLREWARQKPSSALLTFVSPDAPREAISGVTYLRDVKSGTESHKRLLDTHDVFVLPTKNEPFGYALLEAINFGQLVMTTSAAGASSVVLEAEGIVSSTPEDCVHALFDILKHPEIVANFRGRCIHHLPEIEAKAKAAVAELLN